MFNKETTLVEIDWCILQSCNNVDVMIELFYDEVLDRYAPLWRSVSNYFPKRIKRNLIQNIKKNARHFKNVTLSTINREAYNSCLMKCKSNSS